MKKWMEPGNLAFVSASEKAPRGAGCGDNPESR